MSKMTYTKSKRNVGLDLLRISLALLIFMFHSNMHFECHYGVLDHFARYGAIAMTGFFMLSGFAMNFSNKEVMTDIGSLKQFYCKRFVSIAPLYYFVAMVFIFLIDSESWQSLLLLLPFEILGLQTCFSSLFTVSHNGGTWFISCMTICYLLFPFLQWIFVRLSTKGNCIIGGGIFVILLLAPLVQRHFGLASIYDNPFFRLLEFTLGILLFVVNNNIRYKGVIADSSKKIILVVVLVAMIIGVSIGDKLIAPRDYMLMNWVVLPCFIVMFFLFANIQSWHWGDSWIIGYGSSLSYAFFLSQFWTWTVSIVVVKYVIRIDTNIVRILVSLACCITISILLHELVEKTAKKYLNRVFVQ